MNRLPRQKREQIARMQDDGASLREIAEAVGCDRESVGSYGFHGYRKRLWALYQLMQAELDREIEDGALLDTVIELGAAIGWFCPIHPEQEQDCDEPVGKCPACHASGMRRHHERRKAEGRPVLPPRRSGKLVALKRQWRPVDVAMSDGTTVTCESEDELAAIMGDGIRSAPWLK